MSTETEIIKNLKESIAQIDEIIKNRDYNEKNMGTLESFISQIILLAETNLALKGSSIITRIMNLQTYPLYPENMNIIIANAKSLLETIELYIR
jgi:hypothetical protein